MVAFISPTVLLLVCSTLVHGQYGHFRPYPAMAMDHGFSPYHPARINQETLPISQAEFAQLVAESMATSNGPHHHHPPNTDADYEGPEHAMRDQAMLRGGRGIGYSGGQGHHGGHENHHHHHQHDHGSSAHYQPEENYPSPNEHSEADHEDDRYHRAPVYENSYHNDRDEEGDELENQQVNYGGRPGVSDGSGSDAPAYDNYDHPHHLHHPGSSQQHEGQDGEESRMRPMGHYIPVANVPLHSFV